jgi:protein-S-isoprenylcysteine O-methyltransferase Ste14
MMEQSIFKIVFVIGFIIVFSIRIPHSLRGRSNRVVVDRNPVRERILLALLSVGVGVLPLVYILTPWLRFADYQLPAWMGWMGAAIYAVGLWLLWRAHADLGQNWSHTLELRQGHQLVTSGIYGRIRHPMYAFGWLLGIAQALLLWNWVVAVAGLVSFALIYFQRVSREEQMMLDQFGQEYRAYMNRTGRVIPHLKLK